MTALAATTRTHRSRALLIRLQVAVAIGAIFASLLLDLTMARV